MNNNQELLDWAEKNIEVWGNEWTHLRCDATGIFYTRGLMWELDSHQEWVNPEPDFDYIVGSLDVVSVITKEEWQEAKTESVSLGEVLSSPSIIPPSKIKLRVVEVEEYYIPVEFTLQEARMLKALVQNPDPSVKDEATIFKSIWYKLPSFEELEKHL